MHHLFARSSFCSPFPPLPFCLLFLFICLPSCFSIHLLALLLCFLSDGVSWVLAGYCRCPAARLISCSLCRFLPLPFIQISFCLLALLSTCLLSALPPLRRCQLGPSWQLPLPSGPSGLLLSLPSPPCLVFIDFFCLFITFVFVYNHSPSRSLLPSTFCSSAVSAPLLSVSTKLPPSPKMFA